MRGEYYDRQGREVTQAEGLALWATDRRVARDILADDVSVSTVYLVINHQHFDEEEPMIFETMVFGGDYDEWCWRYSTEEQARIGHDRVVTALRVGQAP